MRRAKTREDTSRPVNHDATIWSNVESSAVALPVVKIGWVNTLSGVKHPCWSARVKPAAARYMVNASWTFRVDCVVDRCLAMFLLDMV